MSYDLYMFAPEPGVEPFETLNRIEERDEAPDPATGERNRRLAAALVAANPAYGASEAGPEIQLVAEDGLQIDLKDHHAFITFPYWDSLDPHALTRDIDAAAHVIGEETGWRVFDPQLNRFIEPERDGDDLRAAFERGREGLRRVVAERTAEAAGQDTPPEKPPLWRRLLGR